MDGHRAAGGEWVRCRIAVLCSLLALAVPCGAQPKADVAASSTGQLSGAQAWSIVKRTDRALEQLVIFGIINALNPRGSVTLPNGTVMPLGVRKQQCNDLKSELSEAATAEAYSVALERLVVLGLVQREKADALHKSSAALRKDANAIHPRVADACTGLLVMDLPRP